MKSVRNQSKTLPMLHIGGLNAVYYKTRERNNEKGIYYNK